MIQRKDNIREEKRNYFAGQRSLKQYFYFFSDSLDGVNIKIKLWPQ